ncbi:MAG: hypothetical protein PF549_04490 [Patescibacteria group bacterium]|jgi:hypothetical protein|nr:hypothetical protein [Patescibacteria group bacterium]
MKGMNLMHVDLLGLLVGSIFTLIWYGISLSYYIINRNKQVMEEAEWALEKVTVENIKRAERYQILIFLAELHYKQITKILFIGWFFFIPPIKRWVMKLPKISSLSIDKIEFEGAINERHCKYFVFANKVDYGIIFVEKFKEEKFAKKCRDRINTINPLYKATIF